DNIKIQDFKLSREVNYRGNPFEELKKLADRFHIENTKYPVPFVGGMVGYFGYDLKDFLERLPDIKEDDLGLPDACFLFVDKVLAFDHLLGKKYFISLNIEGEDRREETLTESILAADCIEPEKVLFPPREYEIMISADSYSEKVLKAKEYIASGDIYEVNLSQRMSMKTSKSPWQVYTELRSINPAPFAVFMNMGDFSIVSASPERFIKIEGGHVQSRPIKGTRTRGGTPEEDERLYRQLKESVKDKAENLMIVDLVRNDLGRVCSYGSVEVRELFHIEKYSTVFQMVSTIEGTLREDKDIFDCIKAAFPGGSMTGAPKIRAMEIIEELEPVKRGIYSGSIGYIGFDGTVDLNIVIRTIIFKDSTAYFQAGGAVVADSDPYQEYQESMDKAEALIKALKM
ncbi:MAG: aminodeoxychorismate synthase component I, partial [Firmicutes bacterium]|nr:aminodeoxychorismate synthase component I [Bacillota bacterium]